jgi:hypothetical protein
MDSNLPKCYALGEHNVTHAECSVGKIYFYRNRLTHSYQLVKVWSKRPYPLVSIMEANTHVDIGYRGFTQLYRAIPLYKTPEEELVEYLRKIGI